MCLFLLLLSGCVILWTLLSAVTLRPCWTERYLCLAVATLFCAAVRVCGSMTRCTAAQNDHPWQQERDGQVMWCWFRDTDWSWPGGCSQCGGGLETSCSVSRMIPFMTPGRLSPCCPVRTSHLRRPLLTVSCMFWEGLRLIRLVIHRGCTVMTHRQSAGTNWEQCRDLTRISPHALYSCLSVWRAERAQTRWLKCYFYGYLLLYSNIIMTSWDCSVTDAEFTLQEFSPNFHSPTGFEKSATNSRN